MKLKRILPKKSGRSGGKITVRHQGGRQKRFYREIDWVRRDKEGVEATVVSIEYDPNRTSHVAEVIYKDGERRYILAPLGLKVGDKIQSGPNSPLKPGNSLPLSKIPVGQTVHNIEIRPGKGAQSVRSAGSMAVVQGKEESYVLIKMPSGQIKRYLPEAYATIGQVGNVAARRKRVGKAGVNRRRGKRPTVRGVAMHPGAHPHGGGEGRSGIGMKQPKTKFGKPAVGKTRKKFKYSDKLIVIGGRNV